jgi:tetratricopeptide (TPR) repeat protein
MSRFRREDTSATRDQLLASAFQKAEALPVTAEQAAASKRKKVLIVAGVIVAAAAIVLTVQKLSSKPVEVRNYLADAKRNYDLGKYVDALTSVNLAIRDSKNRVEAYRLRLAINRSLERRADAYEDVGRLIKFEPQVPDHYRTRAELALEMDSVQKAIDDYTILIDRYKDPAAYTGRALCYRKLGNTSQVIADLTKAIELAPSLENYLQRGLAYASVNDHRKAIDDFDRALDINPNASLVYRARAYSRQAVGDTAGSKADSDRAEKLETLEG